ncbi:MAG TPA: BTAD domain-containing putative transcriptional regulator [Gaiellaceae bacterium]|nr:BTAD domain-containing putative transcriptional regulator [Gaiellaceae bacterium]
MIDYRLLGPLELTCDGERVDIGAGKQRALLALLILRGNEPLSAGRLIDLLWDEPPASAAKILQNCVMRLRRALPEGSLLTLGGGYELRIAPEALDADRFARLLEQGRGALGGGDHASAAELLDRALGEWRGAPLRDVGEAPFVEEAVRRLEGLRLGAQVDRAEAALELGRHREVMDELERLVAEHPWHERLRAQLMLALYRSGRQAQALEIYREGRRALVEELGVEPGPELRELEQAILRQAPELGASAAGRPRTARAALRARGRNAVLAAAVLGAALALAAWGFMRGRTAAPASGTPPNSVAVVDAATGRITADLPVGDGPSSIAVAGRTIWVANQVDETLTAVDVQSRSVHKRVVAVASNALASITSVAVAGGSIWAVDSVDGSLTRVTFGGGIIGHIALPRWARYSSDYMTLAAGAGRLWITSSHLSSVLELDPGPGLVRSRIAVPGHAIGAAVGSGAVWCIAAGDAGGLVARIDPTTHGVVAGIPLLGTPAAVTTGFGAVWVAVPARDVVVEIDPRTNAVARTIDVSGAPVAITVGAGGIWVAAARGRRVVRLEPATGATTETISFDGTPRALAVAGGRVWVVGA